jgi:hypothetical protein
MEKDIKEILLSFKKNADCDDIVVKEKIKHMLIDNELIVEVLDNPDLEGCEPDEYLGVNILPYYLIEQVQTRTNNFICYEVSYDMAQSYQYSKSHNALNSTVKTLNVVFHILCDEKNIIERNTGIARHDLLAALIIDQFNWCNEFGRKLILVSDTPSTVDKHYACRTLVFQQTTDNNIVKTLEDGARFINKVNDYRNKTHRVENGEDRSFNG